MDPTNLLL